MNTVSKMAIGLSFATLLAGGIVSGTAVAEDVPGYLTEAGTTVVVPNQYGECWKTSGWTAEDEICECTDRKNSDSDGDGVMDCDDQCPDTPAGVGVNEVGCSIDSDGDGVPDDIDQCPNTPAGVKVDEVGCPLDSDGDGVPDYLDKCPNTPLGAPVDADGCQIDHTVVIQNIEFAFDSAVIEDQFKAELDAVVPRLSNNAKVVAIVVVGHTDSVGAAEYNQGLSERRANAVRDYLADQGVEADKMTAIGRGEEEPIASNATPEGRAENRRVELKIDVE